MFFAQLNLQRAILAKGWGGIGDKAEIPKDIICELSACPHDWLFPQMSAVVHHGGAGTTAAGLRAGKPTGTYKFMFFVLFLFCFCLLYYSLSFVCLFTSCCVHKNKINYRV